MKRGLGVCYYPEHWPQAIWREDARRMAELGLSWVRIGEFAWSKLERRPGELSFDWLDEAIGSLGDAGLKVVLGTPTATPPRWMLDRHPDMLAYDAEGRPRGFGSRRHYCFSHRGYRQECARIVTLLADRYGRNEDIHAWQTDNEYGCHDTTRSYSPAAAAAFREWLAQKYVQIDGLNQAWGNVFWSMDYNDFEEIDLPNLTVTEPNPAHVLDFARFSSAQVASFNQLQVDIIRARSDAPILHNYMGGIADFDHFALGEQMEIAAWDSYPLGFLEDRVDADETHRATYARQGDPDYQAFHHDLYRAVGKGRWWIMEQQPGPVNWAPYNPVPAPGMARLWAWEAFAHGAETVAYFRWRQAPFGQEQMHAGLLFPDGEATPTVAEVAQLAAELTEAAEVETPVSQVALVFDYESAWAWEAQPQGADFSYLSLIFAFYRGLRKLGLSIDIMRPDEIGAAAHALVLAPGLMTDPGAPPRGVLALGPRTGSKTGDMAVATAPVAGAFSVRWVESLRPGASRPLKGGGAFQRWAEDASGGEAALMREDDAPALLKSGEVYYIAGWPDETAMRRILKVLATAARLPLRDMPGGLRRRETDRAAYLINYGAQAARQDGHDVPAFGVKRLAALD